MNATTVDRALLRRLIAGWKPDMTVEVRVRDLSAVLDELDRVDVLVAEVERLKEGKEDADER